MDPCLDERRAGEFVAGHIPSAQRDSIEDHVDECGACRELLAALIRSRPAEAPPGWEGRQVGRYVVRERIGRGGMGEVFRADDRELGRAIALKRLDPGFDRELLLREARAAAQLSHPNVVTVHEVGEADGAPFLAMELVDGTTLTRWLRDESRTWRAIADVLAQAGRGLAAAHARGLVHRDFKPDNVLVDQTGRARVADFGLARTAQPGVRGESQRDQIAAAATAATVLAGGTPHSLASPATALAGTPAYLAPELLDGAAPDARSDQYAFGVAAFEALYGEHPFAGATAEAMWAAMAAGEIKQVRGNVPAWLDRHVRRALAVDPTERWGSVAAFVDAIERGPRRRWPYVAGAFVVANVALAAFLLQPSHSACDARHVDRVWTSEARVLDALRLRSAAPARAGTIASAVGLVDDWSSAWRLGADAACHGEPAVRAAQLGCLEHDLAELRAQLAAWQRPDPSTVDHAVQAIAALPHPDECTLHPPPLAHAPAALVDQIAHINALERDGHPRDAQPILASVLAQASASGDQVTLASALAATGTVERELGDRDHAREHDATAARLAAESGDDALTLAALLEEAQSAIDGGHASDALGLCDAADALAARAHLTRDTKIAVTRADALKTLGRGPEAIAGYQAVIALLVPRATRDRRARLDLAAVYGAVGTVFGDQFKFAEAKAMLEKCLAIEEPELGPDHPDVGRTLHDLANQELGLDDYAAARAHYEQSRAIFVARYGEISELVAGTDLGLGSTARAERHIPEARRYYERANATLHRVLPADHPTFATVEDNLSWCDRDEDLPAPAAEHLKKAIEIREHAGEIGMGLADDHVELATVLWDLERDAEARPHAERGLALHDQLGTTPAGRVNGWLVLQELEADAGHRVRASELAKQILAALGADPREDWVALRQREQARLAELSH
jgi:eukaryotic-like serine/threonine-protein kinase